ncbi:RagB/SusD family nutrient uptake outer membrane protein [Parabacteroides merdae]|nr:RagB/SusD family nutrient uptake outer membrane protein [Parabacteroides merdae]
MVLPALRSISQTSKEVRRLIHKERRVEFVGEGVRYHDLRRWKTAHYGIGNLNEQGENPVGVSMDRIMG